MTNLIKFLIIAILIFINVYGVKINLLVGIAIAIIYFIVDYKQIVSIGLIDKIKTAGDELNDKHKEFQKASDDFQEKSFEMRKLLEAQLNAFKDLTEANTTLKFPKAYVLIEAYKNLVEGSIYYIAQKEDKYIIDNLEEALTEEELNKYFKKLTINENEIK